MFWGFGYQAQTAIDGILDKADVTLEMLLEEDDIIQECKGHHTKLIEFLSNTTNLNKMISYIIEENDELDETKKFKYALICCEILCCELWPILDGIVNHIEILEQFWKYIETNEPLVSYRANCFSRINISLLQAKPAAMIVFIKSRPKAIKHILRHLLNSSISDLLLKIIFIEDPDDTLGISEWLASENIISRLIKKLNPYNEPEEHSLITQILLEINAVNYNQAMISTFSEAILAQAGEGATALLNLTAQQKPIIRNSLIDEIKSEAIFTQLIDYMLDMEAPHSTSSLINGINIIIELIRRYCSDIEQIEYQYHQYKVSLENNTKNSTNVNINESNIKPPTQKQLYKLTNDINTILNIINKRLSDFKNLLIHPKSVTGPLDTTIGKQVPLGSERLRICELFAEIMHLQYLFTSSPLFYNIINAKKYR